MKGLIFGAAALLAFVVVLIFETVLAGLGFIGHINVRWVEREVFLDNYGIEASAGDRSSIAGRLPSCYQEEPTRPATFDASAAACGMVKVASTPTNIRPPSCNPLAIHDYQARTWPFTPYRIQTLVVAAGVGRAQSLPQALTAARSLGRAEFGRKYAPNFVLSEANGHLQEMLVYDDAEPEITAVDCGDHAILGITFDPGSLRK